VAHHTSLSQEGISLEVCQGSLGWSLGVTTSTRGGGHTTGAPLCETVSGLDVEKAKLVYGVENPDKPQEYEGKAQMVTYGETLQRQTTNATKERSSPLRWRVASLETSPIRNVSSKRLRGNSNKTDP
jgi:hypothetical protein